MAILDSFHEDVWTAIEDGDVGVKDCLCGAVGGKVWEWLDKYGIHECESEVLLHLTGIMDDFDFETMEGLRESGRCWS